MKKIQIIIMIISLTIIFGCKPSLIVEPDDDNLKEPKETEISSFSNLESSFSEIIGITYWGSKYLPGLKEEKHSLDYAADLILELGSKVIKIAAGNLTQQYPLDKWDLSNVSNSVEKLSLSPFKKVFNKPFKTYFITISEFNLINWRKGLSPFDQQYVENEFYMITKHLLNTYNGSGKTFILQNWEADNYIGQTNDIEILNNFKTYINLRQDGVNRARDEFVMSEEKNVYVFNALEINRLSESNYLKAVDYVVPFSYCDLYLYSSYEAKDKPLIKTENDVKFKLFDLLTYYKQKLPPIENYPQTMYFGENRIAISEFGYPDSADNYEENHQKIVSMGHVLAQGPLKLQYLLYWQLADNEIKGENKNIIQRLNNIDLRNYQFQLDDLNGFYLLKPDGSKTKTYQYFENLFK